MPAENGIQIRGARVHNLRDVDVDIPRDRLVVVTGVSGCGKSSLAFDTLFAEGQRRFLESLSPDTRQFLDQFERPDVDAIEHLPPTVTVDQRVRTAQIRSTLATTTEVMDYLRVLYARAGEVHCPKCGRAVTKQSVRAIADRLCRLQDRTRLMILAPVVRERRGRHVGVLERIAKEGFVRVRIDGEIFDSAAPPELDPAQVHTIDAIVDRVVIKEGIQQRLNESISLAVNFSEGTCLVSIEEGGAWGDELYSTQFACAYCDQSFPNVEPRTLSFNSPYGACSRCEGLGVVLDKDTGETEETTGRETESSICPDCQGQRLNDFARHIRFHGRSLPELTAMSVDQSLEFLSDFIDRIASSQASAELSPEGSHVARRLLPEIRNRLQFLKDVGLDYLTLDRGTRTLSGGEYQRARLAKTLGAGLTGVCLVLDEPTSGLHAMDTERLFRNLVGLRDQGNTVVVVEHDIDVIRRSDWVVDMGPGAGRDGGRIIAAGTPEEIASTSQSLTGRSLNGELFPSVDFGSRQVGFEHSVEIVGARANNLADLDIRIPLGGFVAVTGVSGSGKTSLVRDVAAEAIKRILAGNGLAGLPLAGINGVDHVERLVEVDQAPIGSSPRSVPGTYSGAWKEIRNVFAKTKEARLRGFKSSRFSFNSKDGRCNKCGGQGSQRISMHILPDIFTNCSQCGGRRFNRQTLGVKYRGKSLADVLEMRFDEAADFFENIPRLKEICETFSEVGLGYLCLGQSSLTLSGGEAQRVKLATELSRSGSTRTLFLLDEPTAGLHPDDILRLNELLHRLINQGNSVWVVEHQLDMISAADWLIDLGPEGGAGGGKVLVAGTVQDVVNCAVSQTGTALSRHLGHRAD